MLDECRSFPDEHAGIPQVISRAHVAARYRKARLFRELADIKNVESSDVRACSAQANISEARFRMGWLDGDQHGAPLFGRPRAACPQRAPERGRFGD